MIRMLHKTWSEYVVSGVCYHVLWNIACIDVSDAYNTQNGLGEELHKDQTLTRGKRSLFPSLMHYSAVAPDCSFRAEYS